MPANGIGTSTAALAVSTSTTGWSTVTASPTATSQVHDLGVGQPLAEVGQQEVGHQVARSRQATVSSNCSRSIASRIRSTAGRWCCLEHRRRVRDVEAGDPAGSGRAGGGSTARSAGRPPRRRSRRTRWPRAPPPPARCGAPSAPTVSSSNGASVRRSTTSTSDRARPARGLGGLQQRGDHGAVADQGDVGAGAADQGPVELGRPRPVTSSSLAQYRRLGSRKITGSSQAIAWRSSQYASAGVDGADHPQAGRVRVVRLGGVAVVLDAADAAAVGDPDHDGSAIAPRVRLRSLARCEVICSNAG